MVLIKILTGETTEGDFATQYHRPVKDWSEDHSKSKPGITVEPYIPPQVQIAEMMDAGARLAALRKARFDSVELQVEGDDIPLDPTREPGVDLVDVDRQARRVAEMLRLKKVKQDKEAKERDEKEQLRLFDEAVNAEIERRFREDEEKPKGKAK